MRKIGIALALFCTPIVFQFCSSSKKAAAIRPVVINYENNIKPVIEANCAPCHIAGKGNKVSLDIYVQASATADDILTRIQKNAGDHGFMPAMRPKLPDSTISLFVQWKNSGLQEK